jgi:hypothetical protein
MSSVVIDKKIDDRDIESDIIKCYNLAWKIEWDAK